MGGSVVRQSVVLVVVGLAAGLALVYFAPSALTHVLYEIAPNDVRSTVIASVALVAASLVACLPPALRAMNVDPVAGLRVE